MIQTTKKETLQAMIAVLVLIALLFALPAISATESDEDSLSGSITAYTPGLPVPSLHSLQLYKVATMTEDGSITPEDEFSAMQDTLMPKSFNFNQRDTIADTAQSLQSYLAGHKSISSLQTARVKKTGYVKFTNLSSGIYLICEKPTKKDSKDDIKLQPTLVVVTDRDSVCEVDPAEKETPSTNHFLVRRNALSKEKEALFERIVHIVLDALISAVVCIGGVLLIKQKRSKKESIYNKRKPSDKKHTPGENEKF